MDRAKEQIRNETGILIETKQTECFMRTKSHLTGSYLDYRFEADIYDVPTEYGIDNGLIVSLYIWKDKKITGSLKDHVAVSFSCTWRQKPKAEEDVKAYDHIRFCLERLIVSGSI